MGYEINWFVDEVDKEFVCPICMLVVERPIESPCEHVFCTKCIVEWVSLDTRCPVDRKPLPLSDLRAATRLYRNLWGKLKVKCPLESMGCDTVMPLEHLETHLTNCTYKPNVAVLCDKGCRLKITRLEYQKSCSAHLATFLKNKFDRELDALKKHIELLNGRIKRHADAMTRLIARTSGAPPRPTLVRNYNMNSSPDEPNIFEPLNHFCWAFAQFSTLDTTITSFRIQILNISDGQYIVIGLTPSITDHVEMPGHPVGSIGYCSRGELVVNGSVDFGLQKWKNGDIVECGVSFSNYSLQAGFRMGEVYFSINGTTVTKKNMRTPIDAFFPTIRMGSFTTSVPKIEYLIH